MSTNTRLAALLALMSIVAGPARAAPGLSAELAPISFLVGEWIGGGKTENGGSAHGTSSIQPVANGGALLRRDHTELSTADGKPAGGFDQIMLIYGEGGAIHADYLDGQHVIHYVKAELKPNAVSFLSSAEAGSPVFRLI